MFLFEVGGGSLGTLTRYYNYLFMYVVSSRILAFWCCFVLTHTQKSRVSAGPDGFFLGQARVNPFGPTQISNFTIVCAWPYGSCDNIGLLQTC